MQLTVPPVVLPNWVSADIDFLRPLLDLLVRVGVAVRLQEERVSKPDMTS